MFESFSLAFGELQHRLFDGIGAPLLYALGLGHLLEDAYVATGWLMVGVIEIGIMLTLLRALERWRPVEPLQDRAAVRVDILYTLIHRLGLFRLVLFFTVVPLSDSLTGWLHLHGVPTLSVDNLWPGVTDIGWVSFLIYLLIFDAVGYAIHRAQHGWDWWWQLHALHHSQRQMTLWSDNRNHLLDSLLTDTIVVLVALLVGIPPEQFVGLVVLTQLMESLSHANVRMSFGPVLGRVLVSPRFHRYHHTIGVGHESEGEGSLGGHNFGVLFTIWDQLAGTARHADVYHPTGIRDQLSGRDYGQGFWAQQRLGLQRLLSRPEQAPAPGTTGQPSTP